MEVTGPQQTKIKFAPTTTVVEPTPSTPTATSTARTTAITPDPGKQLASTQGREVAIIPANPQQANQAATYAEKAKTTKNTEITETTEQTKQDANTAQQQEECTIPTTTDESNRRQPATTTDEIHRKQPAKPNNKENSTETTKTGKNTEYQAIRYRGIIDAPPSDKPFPAFVALLKTYVKTVQETLGKNIYLAPWDQEQEATFPLIKKKEDVPDSRESLGIYLGTYINPKTEGGKIYMNLHWVTFKNPQFLSINLEWSFPTHFHDNKCQ